MSSHWSYWINEPICLDEGVYNILKRKHAMYLFCKDGLVPFLKSYGYSFFATDAQLTKQLLQMCYAMSCGYEIKTPPNDWPYAEDQYNLYSYTLDYECWSRFWRKWGKLQDFQEGAYGYSLQYTLSEIVWSWLNLDASPTAIRLERELDEAENYDEFSKGKDDPYLQETSARDYQDRHWH